MIIKYTEVSNASLHFFFPPRLFILLSILSMCFFRRCWSLEYERLTSWGARGPCVIGPRSRLSAILPTPLGDLAKHPYHVNTFFQPYSGFPHADTCVFPLLVPTKTYVDDSDENVFETRKISLINDLAIPFFYSRIKIVHISKPIQVLITWQIILHSCRWVIQCKYISILTNIICFPFSFN